MSTKQTEKYILSKSIEYIRGTTSFCKVLGNPVLNKFTGEKEWSTDILIDQETEKQCARLGIKNKIKNKEGYADGQSFLTFRHPEKRKNGDLNEPIKVYDAAGNKWPQNRLIGNGSVVDVKFVLNDSVNGMPKGTYIRALRVLEHVPYERLEFKPLNEDDEYFAQANEAEEVQTFDSDDDLDDELPS